MKLDLGKIPARKIVSHVTPKRPAWYKAEQEDKDKFTDSVRDKLSTLQVPASIMCSNPHCQDATHTAERDSLVIDIMSAVIESSHKFIPMSGGKRTSRCPE